jgi:hypothetical protein
MYNWHYLLLLMYFLNFLLLDVHSLEIEIQKVVILIYFLKRNFIVMHEVHNIFVLQYKNFR